MPDERQQVSALVERLGAWVLQQPEYPYLFLADHARRKRAATIVAKRLMLLPTQPPETDYASRKQAREFRSKSSAALGQVRTNLSKRRQRLLAKAERDRKRFRRLSMLRLIELAEREDQERMVRLHQEALDMDVARDLRLAMEADEARRHDEEAAEAAARGADPDGDSVPASDDGDGEAAEDDHLSSGR